MGISTRAALFLGLSLASGVPAIAGCPHSGPDAVSIQRTADGRLTTGDGVEIVLAGIALPETPESAGSLPETLPTEALRATPVSPPDRYGRIAALVHDDGGELVQERLVLSGAAIARPGAVEEACAVHLLASEAEARSQGRGIWRGAGTALQATDVTSLSARSGLYALVQGRVVSVGYGSRMVFIDFGRNFRADFTIMVPEGPLSRLREAGFPLDFLVGRDVRVRGVIEESGGPAIRLTHPLALELLDGTE